MDKKELVEKIESLPSHTSITSFRPYVDKKVVLGLVRQLDEPQKVVVPQFVADWYEEHKKDLGYSIWNYIYYWDQQEGYDFKDWFDYGCCGTIQTLFNMHQFGYEVEEEKRYFVKIKATKHYFSKDGNSGIYYSLAFKDSFTKKQLEEAGFGWVFSCEGIEIEEVEE